MSTETQSFNILTQVGSQNESERIISLFRGAGLNTRVHRITSEQDFNEYFSSESWNLLIVDNQHPEVDLAFSLNAIKAKKLHLPTILLTQDDSAAVLDQARQLGLADIINSANDSGFLHAAKREMQYSQQLQELQHLQGAYNELSVRAEKLLSESDDAIAYISDGIIIQANDNFATAFAFDNHDDLDCAAIIDLISDEDHARFKNFIKLADSPDAENSQFQFKALKHNGETFAAFMQLEAAKLDGEPCTQVNISSESMSSNAGKGTIDSATNLNNRYFLQEQLASIALQAASGGLKASLLVYRLDELEYWLADIHLSGLDTLIRDLASHLQKHIGSGDVLARLGNDAVAVILQQPADKSLDFAKTSLTTIEEHIVDFNGRTIQYTCSCAVLTVNNKDAGYLLDQSFAGISAQREKQPKNSAAIFTPETVKKKKTTAASADNLDDALESNSLKLLYQPIMSLHGDAYENYEATLWGSNEKGEDAYPTALINGAKDAKLDRWIILEATKALAMHQANGHNTRLIINLTVNALKDASLTPWLGVAIKAANLKESAVAFQFLEEDVRNNLKSAITTINALKAAGFFVSIANFGKESDPFKLCSHIKLNLIRIDAHFTQAIASGNTDELKALIKTAKENEIKTILPDVANAGALATLWQLGTHFIQGAYLQLPSPVMSYEFTEIA